MVRQKRNQSIVILRKLSVWLRYIESRQEKVSGEFRLLPVQQSFIESFVVNPNHYNQAVMVDVDGEISHDMLEKVLERLSMQHDMLRMVLTDDGGRILPYEQMKGFELCDVTVDEADEESANRVILANNQLIQRSIDIRKGPMFKVVNYHQPDRTRLFLCAHHLIIDGVSWITLIEDLFSLIDASRKGAEAVLPRKTASFIQWSEHQWNALESARFDEQKQYWNDVQNRIPQGTLNIPDRNTDEKGVIKCVVSLDGNYDMNALNRAAANYLVGAEELLITALARAIGKNYGQKCVAMNIESHGRYDAFGSVSVYRTVGWFTSVYPVVFTISDDVESSVISVKEELRLVLDEGIGYGLLSAGKALKNPKSSPEVTFNYFGNMMKLMGGTVTVDEKLIGSLSDDDNQLETPLVVDVSVVDNYAEFHLSGQKTLFDSNSLTMLAKQITDEIKNVIDYCLEQKEVVRTASDIGAQDMSDDELELLNDFIEGLDISD